MTTLEEVMERVSRLPADEQESFAALMLHHLDSEQRWNDLFERSGDMLAAWAAEAEEEHPQGRTRPLKLDEI